MCKFVYKCSSIILFYSVLLYEVPQTFMWLGSPVLYKNEDITLYVVELWLGCWHQLISQKRRHGINTPLAPLPRPVQSHSGWAGAGCSWLCVSHVSQFCRVGRCLFDRCLSARVVKCLLSEVQAATGPCCYNRVTEHTVYYVGFAGAGKVSGHRSKRLWCYAKCVNMC